MGNATSVQKAKQKLKGTQQTPVVPVNGKFENEKSEWAQQQQENAEKIKKESEENGQVVQNTSRAPTFSNDFPLPTPLGSTAAVDSLPEDASRFPVLDMSGPDGLQYQNNVFNAIPPRIPSGHSQGTWAGGREPASEPVPGHEEVDNSMKEEIKLSSEPSTPGKAAAAHNRQGPPFAQVTLFSWINDANPPNSSAATLPQVPSAPAMSQVPFSITNASNLNADWSQTASGANQSIKDGGWWSSNALMQVKDLSSQSGATEMPQRSESHLSPRPTPNGVPLRNNINTPLTTQGIKQIAVPESNTWPSPQKDATQKIAQTKQQAVAPSWGPDTKVLHVTQGSWDQTAQVPPSQASSDWKDKAPGAHLSNASGPHVMNQEQQDAHKYKRAGSMDTQQGDTAPCTEPVAPSSNASDPNVANRHQTRSGSERSGSKESNSGTWKGIWNLHEQSSAPASDELEPAKSHQQGADMYQKMETPPGAHAAFPSAQESKARSGSHGQKGSEPQICNLGESGSTHSLQGPQANRNDPRTPSFQRDAPSSQWGAPRHCPDQRGQRDAPISQQGDPRSWSPDKKDAVPPSSSLDSASKNKGSLFSGSESASRNHDQRDVPSPPKNWSLDQRGEIISSRMKTGEQSSQQSKQDILPILDLAKHAEHLRRFQSWSNVMHESSQSKAYASKGSAMEAMTFSDLEDQKPGMMAPGIRRSNHCMNLQLPTDGSKSSVEEQITLASPATTDVFRDRAPSFSSIHPDELLDSVFDSVPSGNHFESHNSTSIKVISASALLNDMKKQPKVESQMPPTSVHASSSEKLANKLDSRVSNFSVPSASQERAQPGKFSTQNTGSSRRYEALDLTGQRVLISDATEAIGRVCAFRFAELACDLILLGPDGSELQKLGSELDGEGFGEVRRGRPLRVELVKIDIRETHRIHALAASIGPVDILINNAGMCFLALENEMKSGSPLNKKEHDMLSLVYTSMISPMAFTSAFGYYMRERGSGHILNVENSPAEDINPSSAVYCSAVAGLGAFTTGARHDLVGTAIRVSSISPGYMLSGSQTVGKADCVPLLPEDIADHIIYTCTRPRHVQIANISTYCTNQSHRCQNGIGPIARVGPSLGFDATQMHSGDAWPSSPLSIMSGSPSKGSSSLPTVHDLRVVPGTVVSEEKAQHPSQHPSLPGVKVHRLDRRHGKQTSTVTSNNQPQSSAFGEQFNLWGSNNTATQPQSSGLQYNSNTHLQSKAFDKSRDCQGSDNSWRQSQTAPLDHQPVRLSQELFGYTLSFGEQGKAN